MSRDSNGRGGGNGRPRGGGGGGGGSSGPVGAHWCDFCRTYIRDDAFTRRQHEASDRHRSALTRHAARLSRQHERDDRDRKRVDAEIRRAGGTVSRTHHPAAQHAHGRASTAYAPVEVEAVSELQVDADRPTKRARTAAGELQTKVLDDSSFYRAAIDAKQAVVNEQVEQALTTVPPLSVALDTVPTVPVKAEQAAIDGELADVKTEHGSEPAAPQNSTDTDAAREADRLQKIEAEAAAKLRRQRQGIGDDFVNFKIETRSMPESLPASSDTADDGSAPPAVFKKRRAKIKAEQS